MKARLWAYPWDILDEGPDTVMERVANAGFDEVSVAMLYHGGMLLLPHNPRRKVYFPEDGVVYFVPDSECYRGTSLRPIRSELTKDGDPLSQICRAAASCGLGTVAWVVCLHNGRLGLENPGVALENAFGDRYPYALCPSQPQVSTFLEGVVADLSRRYPLAGIELEALYHQNYPHDWSHPKEGSHRTALDADLLSLCFCRACLSAAAEHGVQGDSVRRAVRSVLQDRFGRDTGAVPARGAECPPDQLDTLIPDGTAYLDVRTHVVTALLKRLTAASQVPIHGIVGSGLLGRERWSGLALHEWAAVCESLTVNCYQREPHTSVEEEITEARRRVGRSALHIGLQATWPHVNAASQLSRRIATARTAQADGVAIYNYGLMPLHHIHWVKDAFAEAAND